MRLIERLSHAKLGIVAGDQRRPLPEARIEHRFDTLRALDLGELRGHVGVFRPIGLVRDHRNAIVADDGPVRGIVHTRVSEVYYITKGSVTVLIEDDTGREIIVAYLNEGDFFGEIGGFTNLNRTCTIVSRTESTV